MEEKKLTAKQIAHRKRQKEVMIAANKKYHEQNKLKLKNFVAREWKRTSPKRAPVIDWTKEDEVKKPRKKRKPKKKIIKVPPPKAERISKAKAREYGYLKKP